MYGGGGAGEDKKRGDEGMNQCMATKLSFQAIGAGLVVKGA